MTQALFVGVRRFFLPERGVMLPRPYAAIAAGAVVVGAALAPSFLVQRAEWALYDRTVAIATRQPQPAPDVVIVAIDEPSFAELKMPWPWQRRVHAALIDALIRGGARTIAFDLVFDEATTTEDDRALADAIRRAGHVVLASDRAVTTDRGYELAQWVEPIPAFAGAAAAIGAVGVSPDPDGTVRRAAAAIDGRPTLPAAAAADFTHVAAETSGDERLLRFRGPPRRGIVTFSYYQALEPGQLPADAFRGKVVIVGRSLSAAAALDQPDHFRTPVAILTPGVEIHANQLDMLLRHTAVADPFGSVRMAVLWAVLWGIIAGFLFFRVLPQLGLVILATAACVGIVASYVAFALASVRVPVVAPIASALAVYGATSAYRFALGQRERRLIFRAFQHYLAPAIVQQILEDPSRLKLGGEAFDVTVLFTDLEGFTTYAEPLAPEELRSRLSTYFRAMVDALLAERATLDKFIGDAVMAYFGCPIADPSHPAQACRAALAMHRRLDALNDEWRRLGLPALRMRVGVNTGRVVAGNMGTDEMFNYTIVGNCVNLASRLEGVNKQYGTRTIIGADTWQHVRGQFEVRELDWIRVKGKTEPVAIYELFAEAGQVADRIARIRDRYEKGLSLYRAGDWVGAGRAFAGALEFDPSDVPSRVFAARCAEYAAAPPREWDGVHVMTVK